MKVPDKPLTPQEIQYNISQGIFDIVEAMWDKKEQQEKEDR